MSLKEVSSTYILLFFYLTRDGLVSVSLVNPKSNRKALTLEGRINSPGKPLDFSLSLRVVLRF